MLLLMLAALPTREDLSLFTIISFDFSSEKDSLETL